MRFTVVTPSFNQGQFIGRCLHSVDAQSNAVEVEHIVLDNCSTDTTHTVLAAHNLQSTRVNRVTLVEKDRGQTHAINKGFGMASGDILCWLNTDEYYEPDSLHQVADYFKNHPDVDVVYGNVAFVDADARLLRVRCEPRFSEQMLLYYGCFIPSCSTFIRRSAAQRAGELDESLKVVMDFEWYLRLSRTGAKFAYLNALLASFTWHDSNISSTFTARRRDERFRVQSNFSRLRIPAALRPFTYSVLKYWWVAVRSSRRYLLASAVA